MFFLLLLAFSALLQLFLPWWISGALAFSMAMGWNKNRHSAFFEAGCSQAILWLMYATFQDINNHHILSPRMAALFSMPAGWVMPLLSAFLVFITSGLAAYAGARVRESFLPPSPKQYPNGDL